MDSNNYTSSEIDAIVDFAEKGYEIFRTKTLDAKSVLNILINIKPSLYNITVSIADNKGMSNSTDEGQNTKNNSSTGKIVSDLQSNVVIETNTQSPIEGTTTVFDAVNVTETIHDNATVVNFKQGNIEEYTYPTDFTSSHNFTEEHRHLTALNSEDGNTDSSHKQNSTEHEHVDMKKLDDSEGFFSKIGQTLVDVYHSLTSWI